MTDTFNCAFCKELDFSRDGMKHHINTYHARVSYHCFHCNTDQPDAVAAKEHVTKCASNPANAAAILITEERESLRAELANVKQMYGFAAADVTKLHEELKTEKLMHDATHTKLSVELKKAQQEAKDEKHSADMYANAWARELKPLGAIFRQKHHHIDAMVMTTQDVVKELLDLRERAKSFAAPEVKFKELERKIASLELSLATANEDMNVLVKKYFVLNEEFGSLFSAHDFWKARAKSWREELFRRADIRAMYDPLYAMMRRAVRRGMGETDPEAPIIDQVELEKMLEQAKGENIDLKKLAAVAMEFGVSLDVKLVPKGEFAAFKHDEKNGWQSMPVTSAASSSETTTVDAGVKKQK